MIFDWHGKCSGHSEEGFNWPHCATLLFRTGELGKMKAIKLIKALSIGAVLSMGLSLNAYGLAISPGQEVLSGNDTGQSAINVIIFDYMVDGTLELYKADVVGEEPPFGSDEADLPLAGNYNTVFGGDDPNTATITHTGGAFVGPIAYLLVKDGNASPAWYLFNLTALGWNGTDTLELSGFWDGVKGAISHVTLYGTQGTEVPEPGTLALLGLGLVGFGLARRRRSA
jgi:hypothetical protein